MALKGLFLISVMMCLVVEHEFADVPVTVKEKPKSDIKRRNDVIDGAFLEQKDVLLDMLETKLKEVRDKKKKKADRSDTNNTDTVKCDSQPGNVDLKLKGKGLSAVGDAEISLNFGNSGKATLNLDASGISNVGKARLDLGVDDGGLYVPGLSNLFVGKSFLSNCSNQNEQESTTRGNTKESQHLRSGNNIGNKTISNNVTDIAGTVNKPEDSATLDNNTTVSSKGPDKANVTLENLNYYIFRGFRGARWRNWLARSAAIVEVKQFSQGSVIGWVTKNLLSRAPPCFGRHVKPLVPVASAVVSAHQSALGPRGGSWPNLPIPSKGKACASAVGTLIG
ncbi:hypothetical protein evm_005373 [Chilo suppressalis]|nr:hypothetical protein evm_005373 [Chilo suppressalis]